ncbi:uncharacterized protein LOC112486470 isoform X2 [Cynoglossus semilaevis]|uniref:uncharacterized protein LOC112486470 isoform X2 n=1 Tax=Cynoglossus semilaevis TaxID=244447 RepID=UPI000D628166|nr:uncharacterized protein LOC112486470 isoform X2 [Cynoglossus semilaevis]
MGDGESSCPVMLVQDLQQLDVNLLCWGSGELGQTVSVRSEVMSPDEAHLREFTKARLGAVKLLSCGSSHCVVVTEEHKIFVWGNGTSGHRLQL